MITKLLYWGYCSVTRCYVNFTYFAFLNFSIYFFTEVKLCHLWFTGFYMPRPAVKIARVSNTWATLRPTQDGRWRQQVIVVSSLDNSQFSPHLRYWTRTSDGHWKILPVQWRVEVLILPLLALRFPVTAEHAFYCGSKFC